MIPAMTSKLIGQHGILFVLFLPEIQEQTGEDFIWAELALLPAGIKYS
jgi:hypothetical protein